MKRAILAVFTLALALTFGCRETAQITDPLPSWNDGKSKQSIIEFVEKVTTPGSPDFVPPEERIATFDQDGTLWCEQPVVQMEFVIHQIKKMALDHPEWKDQLPY
ncbi:MAG: haloacid dehalogenase-like hydrolase, partial [Thermoanaerobaculia bacterium]